jgi:hypothetical protein
MPHHVPPDQYTTTLTVIKVEGGIEVMRTSIKSAAAVSIPQLGSIYELSDFVDGRKMTGVVTNIVHKNTLITGPVFEGNVEVTIK